MTNLFILFDPQRWGGPWLWIAIFGGTLFLPSSFWLAPSFKTSSLIYTLIRFHSQIKDTLSPLRHPGLTHWALRIFSFLSIINLGGLLPYVFTPTRHLRVTLSLGVFFWLSYFIIRLGLAPTYNLAHLIPQGTPRTLQPFIVCVETVRSVIRPITLSVRLAANMVAGHLLIALVAEIDSLILMGVGTGALIVLETLVALVQAYVFTLLGILYLAARNSPRRNFS